MKTRVVVESGDKRVFVSALDWPGWARGGKSRDEALATFIDYGSRYKKSVGSAASELELPASAQDLDIVATTSGDKNVDYGVPHGVMKPDHEKLSDVQLEEQIKRLKATWKAFESAAIKAKGKTLTTGPRGGGRTVAQMVEHVHGADREAYIPTLGAKAPPKTAARDEVEMAFVEALHAKLLGQLPEKGPRGGDRWPARYAIRRSAWHALDHAWEIEDRSS